jgi:hypothetical protein
MEPTIVLKSIDPRPTSGSVARPDAWWLLAPSTSTAVLPGPEVGL